MNAANEARTAVTNSLGVAVFSKRTGKPCITNRGPRTYRIRVVDAHGQAFVSNREFDSYFMAISAANKLARDAGLPSSWDGDVFVLHYVPMP